MTVPRLLLTPETEMYDEFCAHACDVQPDNVDRALKTDRDRYFTSQELITTQRRTPVEVTAKISTKTRGPPTPPKSGRHVGIFSKSPERPRPHRTKMEIGTPIRLLKRSLLSTRRTDAFRSRIECFITQSFVQSYLATERNNGNLT